MLRKILSNDSGSALVAAMGVALIGVVLSIIVVTQAIVLTNDAQTSAVRTSEVHAAEAALDTVIETLNVSNPCPMVEFNNVAQGTVAVDVVVEISYADDNGPLTTCNASGLIAGTPTRATLIATATPVIAQSGVEPVRVMEAAVTLTPRSGQSAAIFSATQPATGAGFSLAPLVPDQSANVWVDAGNFDCNTSVQIDGDLTVVQGGATLQKNCSVAGSIWTKNTITVNDSAAYRAGDGVTVQNGNLFISNANQLFYGNIYLGGTVQGWNSNTMQVVNGSVFQNQTIAALTPMGLPSIGVVPTDWAGFTWKDRAGWKTDMLANTSTVGVVGGINQYQTGQLDSCTLANWMANQQTGGFAVVNIPGPTAYDLTGATGLGCNQLTLQNTRFVLSGDVVFFVKSLQAYNPIEVVSKDGLPHKIWFIVPDDNHASMPASYTDGSIGFHSSSNKFQDPINIFLYSPNQIDFYNSTYTNGQIYAGKVNVHPVSEFRYTSINVPGVDLSASRTASGSYVTIGYKREISS